MSRRDHDLLCVTVAAVGTKDDCDCDRIELIRKDEMGRIHATWKSVITDVESRAEAAGMLRAAAEIGECEHGCHRKALGRWAPRVPVGPVHWDASVPLAWTAKR